MVAATGIPVVTLMVPDSGKSGDTITLRGANFGVNTGKVGFQDGNGNIDVASIVSWADETIVLKVPVLPGSPSTSTVNLQTSDGRVLQLNPTFTVVK